MIQITYIKDRFVGYSQFSEHIHLKAAGFLWDADFKRWTSTDFRPAEKLKNYCDQTALVQIKLMSENTKKAIEESAKVEGSMKIYHPDSITPYPYQIAGVEYMLKRKSVLLADEMGLGKGLEVNTLVFTPKGKKKIGELVVGDEVIGSDGMPTKVLGVFPQGRKALYEIKFNDGFSILADDEHLWRVSSRNNHRSFVLSTQQLIDQELIISLNGKGWNAKRPYSIKTYYKESNGNNKWQIPVVKPIAFESNDVLPIDSYLLGVILGDGCISGRKLEVTLHKNDFSEMLFGFTYTEQKSNKANLRIAHFGSIRKHINDLGIAGKKANNKFIPYAYKYSSVEQRLRLLQGLMDTDGTPLNGDSGTEFCTVSKQLSDDVCELVQSLGGIVRVKTKMPRYTYNGQKKIGQKAYRLNIKLPIGMNPFRLKRKAEKYIHPSKYPVSRYIESIEFKRYGESVCIKVDAKDQLFVAEHGIVTHNTGQALLCMNMRKDVEALIVCPAILKYNWLKEARKWMIGEITAYIYESKKIRYYTRRLTNHNKKTILHIINYDILEKFKERLMGTPYNFIVCDECFVYDTIIDTDSGKMKIGDIVEHRLPVKVLSYNHNLNRLEWKSISRYLKKNTKKKLFRIKHKFGTFICTPNHKIFTLEDGYVRAEEIHENHHLFVVRNDLPKEKKREKYSTILQPQMLRSLEDEPARNSFEGFEILGEQKEIPYCVELSYMQKGLLFKTQDDFLFEKMLRHIQVKSSAHKTSTARDNKNCSTIIEREEKTGCFGSHEKEQSYVQSIIGRKDDNEKQRANISFQRRKFTDNHTAGNIAESLELTCSEYGISYQNKSCEIFIPITSNLLQSGYSHSRNKIGDRGGRKFTQDKEVEIFGQEESGGLECVRVESIEILESSSYDGYAKRKDGSIEVYDLEIEDNHNYFADTSLVSNCHYIKNGEAKRTKIAQELARKAMWKIFITGTPIYNKPKDLYVAMNLIDPNTFGNFFHFASRYCGAKKMNMGGKSIVKFDGASNIDELNQILRSNYMVRRMTKDVLKDLPEKVKDVIVLNEDSLDNLVKQEQNILVKSAQEQERLKAEIAKLREMAKENAAYEAMYKDKVKSLKEAKFKSFGELSRLRKEMGVKKLPYVVEYVKEILENSEDPLSKVVIFGHHTEVLEKLHIAMKKYNPVIITGKISDVDRQKAIGLFKEKNKCRVFIGSMGAAGTGVDGLQNNCNTVVFAELDWTPSLVDQAEARLARIGQTLPVFVYHIVADGSIDSHIAKLMVQKTAVAKEILDYRPDQIYEKFINEATGTKQVAITT